MPQVLGKIVEAFPIFFGAYFFVMVAQIVGSRPIVEVILAPQARIRNSQGSRLSRPLSEGFHRESVSSKKSAYLPWWKGCGYRNEHAGSPLLWFNGATSLMSDYSSWWKS